MRAAAVPAALLGVAMTAPIAAETVLPVPAFRSVALQNGGQVILRHAGEQRVILREGNTTRTRTWIEDGDRLVIDGDCRRGYQTVVEIYSPVIEQLRVTDGGTIECRGSFPRQAALAAAVDDGGAIDVRAMKVDAVAAAVSQGGMIFTRPAKELTAAIAQGGAITYWGNPEVTSSIQHGGVVGRGRAGDESKPLPEVGPGVQALPPVPPVPPTPRMRHR